MSIDPSRVHVRGPLAPFAAGFADELARQGYTPLSARNQMWLLAHLSRWLEQQALGVDELNATEEAGRYSCGSRPHIAPSPAAALPRSSPPLADAPALGKSMRTACATQQRRRCCALARRCRKLGSSCGIAAL